jgi:hypothetical protein
MDLKHLEESVFEAAGSITDKCVVCLSYQTEFAARGVGYHAERTIATRLTHKLKSKP